MANHNVFLKYDGSNLLWSETENGDYAEVTENSPHTSINGTDTITFKAISGIDKIQKIDDGIKGTKKMFKSKKGEDSETVVATINDKTVRTEIYKYDIIFKPKDEEKSVIVDPQAEGGGTP